MGVALAAVLALGGVGCGNISLSSEMDLAPATGGGTAPGRAPDAGADASLIAAPSSSDGATSGPPPGTGTADAGTASPSSGNPLCFFAYGSDAGAHACQPDPEPPSNLCPGGDAGWYIPPPSDDAGEGGAPSGPACHVIANGQTCLPAGSGGDGAQCQTSTDCAVSFECVGSPGQCRHYCCGGNSACDNASAQTAGATFCDVAVMTTGGLSVPVCEPVRNCNLLLMGTGAGTCPGGETCAVVKDDGTTSCVPIGAVGIRGSCDVYHCAAELTCLGAVGSRTCYQLCQVDSPTACPSGTTCTSSAQLFSNANIGICQ